MMNSELCIYQLLVRSISCVFALPQCYIIILFIYFVQIFLSLEIYLMMYTDTLFNFYTCTVWVKKSPLRGPDIFQFFHKRLRIFYQLFIHLLHVPIYARLQIFIQLSSILTKLCHIKRDYPVHIIRCSECPPLTEVHAFTRLRKSLIALLIVVCGK